MKKLLLSLSFMALAFANIKAASDTTINETTAEQTEFTENNDQLILRGTFGKQPVKDNDSKNSHFQAENKSADTITRQLTDAFAMGICVGVVCSLLIAMLIQDAAPRHRPSLLTLAYHVRF
jgi:hypothetical protein